MIDKLPAASPQELAKQSQDATKQSGSLLTQTLSGVSPELASLILSRSILPTAGGVESLFAAIGELANQKAATKYAAEIPTDVKVTQDFRGPRQLIFEHKIYALDLNISDTVVVSLARNYESITITESLDAMVSGNVTFVSDQDGILEKNLPLAGQKPITFEWGMPLFDGTIVRRKVVGFLYNCRHQISNDPHRRRFSADFIGSDTIKDVNQSISKAYHSRTVREIIEDLLAAMSPLQVIPSVTLLPDDERLVVQQFVVSGFRSPIETIKGLLATHTNNTYDFFQRLTDKGQQFVIQPLGQKKNLDLIYVIGQKSNMQTSETNVRDKYGTIKHRFSMSHGYDDYLNEGMLASRVVVASPTRKRFMVEDYDRQADHNPVLNNPHDHGYLPLDVVLDQRSPMYPNANNRVYIVPDQASQPSSFTGTAKAVYGERSRRRMTPLQMRNSIVGELLVGGNVALSPGCLIEIEYPSTVDATMDTRFSGFWAVSVVSHMFRVTGEYLSSMEVVRETVSAS